MVLPTNCDEAPRLGTNLKPRFCRWASAASMACAIDSMLLAWKDLSIYVIVCLSVRLCGAFPAEAQKYLVALFTHASLSTRPCSKHVKSSDTAGCQGTWRACPQTDRRTTVAWLQYKLCRRCSLIERTEVSGYLYFRTKVSSIKHRTQPSILITSTHFLEQKLLIVSQMCMNKCWMNKNFFSCPCV